MIGYYEKHESRIHEGNDAGSESEDEEKGEPVMKNIEVFLKKYREEIHRSAYEILLLSMPDVTEELFAEFERTGERLGYEKVYFTRRKYLAISGMEGILRVKEGEGFEKNDREGAGAERNRTCDGKAGESSRTGSGVLPEEMVEKRDLKKVLRKLCAVIESVCSEETWALPAHVNRKAENWQVTVDLFAAETAQTLADLMDELWDELPEATILRIQKEICRRVLEPFFGSEAPYSWWEGSGMNWNAVCAGSIGSVCIHFHNRGLALPTEFSACISRICSSLTHYIDGFSDDGACMEGLGYYTYGMAFYVNFMRELEEVLLVSDQWNSDSSVPVTAGLNSEFPESAMESWCSDPSGSAVDRLPSNPPKTDSSKSPELIKSAKMAFRDEKFIGKLRRIAEFPGKCFFSDGRSVSFSDGDSRDTWRVGIWCALDAWFDGLPLPNLKSAAGVHADSCYRFVNLKMDVFESEKYLEKASEQTFAKSSGSANRTKTDRTGIGETNKSIKSYGHQKNISTESYGRQKNILTESYGCQENISTKLHGRADILTDAQWCIAESANGVGFACKGGHNDEPHNHNDVGHFIYESGGTVFLADLGAGEYTADYFGAKRYQILCNSSAGHSVPVLNGENQRCGREYRCGRFAAHVDDEAFGEKVGQRGESSCGADLRCRAERGNETGPSNENKIGGKDFISGEIKRESDRILCVQLDIGSAWPQKEGRSAAPTAAAVPAAVAVPALPAGVHRTFHFDLQTGRLEMEDIFDRTQWESVSETLITQIPPQLEENKVYLRGDSGTVEISVRDVGEEQSKSAHLENDVFSENAGDVDDVIYGNERDENDAVSENERDVNDAVSEIDGSTNVETPRIRVRKLEHKNHVGEAETVYAICRDVRGARVRIDMQYISC